MDSDKLSLVLDRCGLSLAETEMFKQIPYDFLSYYARRETYLKRTGYKLDVVKDVSLVKVEYNIFCSLYATYCNKYRIVQTLLESCLYYDFCEKMCQEDRLDYIFYAQNAYSVSELKDDFIARAFSVLEEVFFDPKKK